MVERGLAVSVSMALPLKVKLNTGNKSGFFFWGGGLHNKDYSIWESISGSPQIGKLSDFQDIHQAETA